jgi:hypothetical protein
MFTPNNQRPQCPEREEGISNKVNSTADLVLLKSVCYILSSLPLIKGGKGVNQELLRISSQNNNN